MASPSSFITMESKPRPSPMELHDVSEGAGELDDGFVHVDIADLDRCAAEHQRMRAQNKKIKAITQRVRGEDAYAQLAYKVSHRPPKGDLLSVSSGRGYQVTQPSCGFAERLFFYSLSLEDQQMMRSEFQKEFREYRLVELLHSDPRLDTLMFAHRHLFHSMVARRLTKAQVEGFKRQVKELGQMDPSSVPSVTAAYKSMSKISLEVQVAVDMAIEKDTAILGKSWTKINAHSGVLGADHAKVQPCSIEQRVAFYQMAPAAQRAIRTSFYENHCHHTQLELRKMDIVAEAQLAQLTNGRYTSFASLVTEDLLFGDQRAFKAAVKQFKTAASSGPGSSRS